MKLLGAMLLRFFAGLGMMLLVSVPGTCVCSFPIALILQPNPHDASSILYAFPAAVVLGLAGLAWFSIRRHGLMPLWGGFTLVAAECVLIGDNRGRDQYGGTG